MKIIKWMMSLMFLVAFLSGCSNKAKASDIYYKALNAYVNKRFDDCLSLCEQAISYDSNMEKAMFLEAKTKYFLGDSNSSCEMLKKLDGESKGYTDASLYYVHGLLDMERINEADTLLNNLLEWNQNDYRLWYLKSLASRKLGNIREQLECLKKAELCLSDSAKVYSEMSLFYKSLDMTKTAEDYETLALSFSKGAGVSNE